MNPFDPHPVGCVDNLANIGGTCSRACGGLGSRPCTIFERIPSCDSGLIEVGNACLLFGDCGAEGGRACLVFERLPSCNQNLVESNGRCVHPPCGRVGERACLVTERIPSCDSGNAEFAGRCYTFGDCGGEGGRPCTVVERIPSCNPNLVESGSLCVHPPCGRLSERACLITERIPSCDSGLVEFAGQCFNHGECGSEGGRPCTVVERIPSCDPNLVESGGRCVHPPCGRRHDRACLIVERLPSCDSGLTELGGMCFDKAQDCGPLRVREALSSERLPVPAGTAPLPRSAALRVGVAISDITGPAAEVPMMGYAKSDQETAGIHTRLHARAFVFWNAETNKRIAYVSADLGQAFGALKHGVLAKLATQPRLAGLYDERNLQIAATHTHSGPGGYAHYTLYNLTTRFFNLPNYTAIVDGIARAIVQAHDNATAASPALVRFAAGPIQAQASVNRSLEAFRLNREICRPGVTTGCIAPTDNVNPTVSVLRLDTNGAPVGAISWFSVHNTSLPNTNHFISSDHKGWAAFLFEKERGTIAPFLRSGQFVAAFPNSDEGDLSPNIGPGFTGPVPGDPFASARTIGERQFQSAFSLFNNEALLRDVGTQVDYRHRFVTMPGFQVASSTYRNGAGGTSLCSAALGLSFAAGAEDGPSNVPGLREGMKAGDSGLPVIIGAIRTVFDALLSPLPGGRPIGEEGGDAACQHPKPVLVPTGAMNLTPSVLPFQILRVGKLAIAGVPGEMTVQAGRRLRSEILYALRPVGVEQVVISGLANEYSGYITTPEEYDSQQYEGASTLFGRLTFEAYRQIFRELAQEMAGRRAPPSSEPASADQGFDPRAQFSLDLPVIFDGKDGLERFGQVLVEPATSALRGGGTVSAAFRSGHPKNDLFSNHTYFVVERQAGTSWRAAAWDSTPSARFDWARDDCLACSRVTVRWDVPADALAGTYRIRHFGAAKLVDPLDPFSENVCRYSGETRTFEVR